MFFERRNAHIHTKEKTFSIFEDRRHVSPPALKPPPSWIHLHFLPLPVVASRAHNASVGAQIYKVDAFRLHEQQREGCGRLGTAWRRRAEQLVPRMADVAHAARRRVGKLELG